MTLEVRRTRPDEYRAAAGAMAIALMNPPPSDERWEQALPSWEAMSSFAAFDGDACVGHAGQFVVGTTVPGGASLPTGAVSRVGVLATHRRRGLARRLVHALIDDADQRGLVLMSLRASETTIYERFGFGMGGEYAAIDVDRRRAGRVRGADPTGSIRILRPDEVLDAMIELNERVGHRHVGAITRPPSWLERIYRTAIDGTTAAFVAVHTNAEGVADGYVHYETEWDHDHPDGPTGKGQVHDLFGATDGIELALWQFVLDVDLVARWRAESRPLDDPLRHALTDTRAYRVRSVDDEQWVRLVDVDAALAARTYRSADGEVRVQITDPVLAGNSGTWSIGAGGAHRTGDAPDLVTDIAGLSAAYLGGTSWSVLRATGRVDERTPGSVAIADDLFASVPLPFCGTFF